MTVETVTKQIAIDEDVRLKPYDDATGKELKAGDTIIGKITIGAGRNLSDVGISEYEAMVLNTGDLRRTIRDLDNAFPWWRTMTDARQDALQNICFNVGLTRLLTFKKALTFLQAGRWDAAAAEFKDSKWYGQVGQRAERIIKQIAQG